MIRNKWPRTRRVDYQRGEGEGFKGLIRWRGSEWNLAEWLLTFNSHPGVLWWRTKSITHFPMEKSTFGSPAICLWSSSKSSFSLLPRKTPNSEDWCILLEYLLWGAVGEILRRIERINSKREEKKIKGSKCRDPKTRNRSRERSQGERVGRDYRK